MPANPKCPINGFVHETCLRTEEGLPLPPNPIILAIVKSVLARAQTFYPVIICHFLLMSNHLHFLYIVRDPEDVADFVGYLKRELAHSINRLRGRRKKTVFEEDFSSPPILDAQKAKERVVYILTNPQKAGLVDKIEDYPSLSSWDALKSGDKTKISCRRINRDAIKPLPGRTLSLDEMRKIAASFKTKDKTEYEIVVQPNAWMQCFDETKDLRPEEVNAEIISMVRDAEAEYRGRRTKPVMGAQALILQSMNVEYVPSKHSPKMICLSSIKELRVAFISWFREHICACLEDRVPPGRFLPGGRLVANLNPLFVPCANNYLFA